MSLPTSPRPLISSFGLSLTVILAFGCYKQPPEVSPAQTLDTTAPTSNTNAITEMTPEAASPSKQPAETKITALAFQEAALQGQIETVRQAIEQGVDVRFVDAEGRSALMLAAFDGHTNIVRLLLENDSPANHVDCVGRTALIYASSGPNHETVQALLNAGADPDVVDKVEGFTALMFAAAEGQKEVVQALLKFKANKSLKDKDGDTARDFATKNGHPEIAKLLK